jgi:hypothetical protein
MTLTEPILQIMRQMRAESDRYMERYQKLAGRLLRHRDQGTEERSSTGDPERDREKRSAVLDVRVRKSIHDVHRDPDRLRIGRVHARADRSAVPRITTERLLAERIHRSAEKGKEMTESKPSMFERMMAKKRADGTAVAPPAKSPTIAQDQRSPSEGVKPQPDPDRSTESILDAEKAKAEKKAARKARKAAAKAEAAKNGVPKAPPPPPTPPKMKFITHVCKHQTPVKLLEQKSCAACQKSNRAKWLQKQRENGVRRAEKRPAARLPDQSCFTDVTWNEDLGSWTGTLKIPGKETFTASAPGVFRLLQVLDETYRAWEREQHSEEGAVYPQRKAEESVVKIDENPAQS